MRYRVTAPLVIAYDQDGLAHHKYEGQVLPWLSAKQSAHLLEMGMVEPLHDHVPDESDAPTQEPGPPAPTPAAPEPGASDPGATPNAASRPLQVARKEAWIEYAIAAHHIDRAEAEAMTLDQLKALPAE